jgi:hypothetical protein
MGTRAKATGSPAAAPAGTDMVSASMPAWIVAMREAARAEIKDDDIREIVRNQVARAKAGDKAAISFVFDQVLGGSAFKGATFNQNHYYGREAPAASEPADGAGEDDTPATAAIPRGPVPGARIHQQPRNPFK